MDYSKFYSSIMIHYLSLLVAIIIGLVLVICADVFCIKAFLKQNAVETETKIWFFSNKGSLIDFLGVIVFIIVALLILFFSRNILADIPNVINKNYVVTSGVVTAHDSSGKDDVAETRSFTLKDFNTGKEVKLLVTYTPIRQGDIYEVLYLPSSKAGAIVRKIEDLNEVK